MAHLAYPDATRAAAPKGPGIKLTARIVEWDQTRGRGTLSFEKHRIPLQRDDFVVEHKRPEVGDVVEFPTPDGAGKYAGAVLEVRGDGAVRFDFNHPLAGLPVTFEVQLIGVL